VFDAAGWSLYHSMDGISLKIHLGGGAGEGESAGADMTAAAKAGDTAVAADRSPRLTWPSSLLWPRRGVIGSLILVPEFPNTLYNVGAMNTWNAQQRDLASDPGCQRHGKPRWCGDGRGGLLSRDGLERAHYRALP